MITKVFNEQLQKLGFEKHRKLLKKFSEYREEVQGPQSPDYTWEFWTNLQESYYELLRDFTRNRDKDALVAAVRRHSHKIPSPQYFPVASIEEFRVCAIWFEHQMYASSLDKHLAQTLARFHKMEAYTPLPGAPKPKVVLAYRITSRGEPMHVVTCVPHQTLGQKLLNITPPSEQLWMQMAPAEIDHFARFILFDF